MIPKFHTRENIAKLCPELQLANYPPISETFVKCIERICVPGGNIVIVTHREGMPVLNRTCNSTV